MELKVTQLLKNSYFRTEKNPPAGPYHRPDKSSIIYIYLFKTYFNIILHAHGSPSCLPCSRASPLVLILRRYIPAGVIKSQVYVSKQSHTQHRY